MLKVLDVLKILEKIAPLSMAESYDNVGLLVGDKNASVDKIMCVLDVTNPIVDEAIEKDVNLIISHHPLLFGGINNIDYSTYKGEIITKLIKNDISYIAIHTNFDKCKGGLNDYLSQLIKLQNVEVLENSSKLYGISFYVPSEDKQKVKTAMFEAGAGDFGNYSDCCFEIQGKGQFTPKDNANPYLGQKNKECIVDEVKVEMVCDEFDLPNVINALKYNHPYEQVAYSVVENKINGKNGFGRIGYLEKEVTLEDFCKQLKNILELKSIKFTGNKENKIKRVALCTGAGADLYYMALKKGADAYITGDVKHNLSVEAMENGTSIIDAGHYGTEVIFKKICMRHLQEHLNKVQYNVNVICSDVEKSPWDYV